MTDLNRHPVDFLDCEWCVTPQEHADAARAAAPLMDDPVIHDQEWPDPLNVPSPDPVAGLRDPLAEAMNEAYTYEDRDNNQPTLRFVDDIEGFWQPFAEKVAALLAEPVPLDVERLAVELQRELHGGICGGRARHSPGDGPMCHIPPAAVQAALARLTDPKGATDAAAVRCCGAGTSEGSKP